MKHLPFLISLAIAMPAVAQTHNEAGTTVLPEMKVIVTAIGDGYRPAADSALMLSSTPGYSVAAGGGVSGLPVVNGFADDRLKIRIDGMELTSACANHMNAPLSYIDPQQVQRIRLIAGVTPVSAGGDSIGGTIEVQSNAPVFARPGAGLLTQGSFAVSGRSVNNSVATSVHATAASDVLSIGYSGAYTRGHSYEDGHGNTVLGSMFESINQAIVLAAKGDGQQLTLRAGVQHIPYQGFPNQYMDMTDNHGQFANLAYQGTFAWGVLDARAYWQQTDHEMGFFTPERKGSMPMITHGRNTGYALMASLPTGAGELRLGQEWHGFRLDDYWPAVPGSMMMGPRTYLNINDGKRDRTVLFGELETRHAARWTSVLGVRGESVRMDAGDVQSYGTNMMNMPDVMAAKAFNARSRSQRDTNIDASAQATFTPDLASSYAFALARKVRSPNLYERYSWGRGSMAMTMTNWFGDGNGYVGDIDLKPETAYTAAFTADWHGGGEEGWFLRVNPYYSKVDNYIDVDVLASFHPYMKMGANGNLLRFANHDAKLYGANLAWQLPLASSARWGRFMATGNAAYTRGKRSDAGDLYRMMPFNALLAVEHKLGAWSNRIETKIVARKDKVDVRRFEPETGGYALVNLRSSVALNKMASLSAGVSNLFNRAYADPLGGVYLSGLKANGGALQALPAEGRSIDMGLQLKF
ncbi:vitamin B12 transporter BtuB [Janthinobacterium sp. HH103]|uniref:TonB-dependent receptor n=1 Tax=unclassified Janthinobacterium TaxID=2610881 RepID=UPI0008752A67|nr:MULTISPECIES: TonB-dependent receptor [unclassified Janthinobacterium]OEZ54201.1 vitamin B12 transporter BtuB [Janthinobacterium sp. HH100]OEZ69816.1 vitamin B12 transporter BtuB [Janthinobacterium sp. HH103]OEZ93251.1 vitamin B12 transporter BtuB [Janthinobacterium sp. HH106]QOU73488.1 TonB dependent receptor [Janthinobacterium sp. HH102]